MLGIRIVKNHKAAACFVIDKKKSSSDVAYFKPCYKAILLHQFSSLLDEDTFCNKQVKVREESEAQRDLIVLSPSLKGEKENIDPH